MVDVSGVHRSLLAIGISVLLLAECTNGAQLFSNSTIPTNITVVCSNSLLSDVDCGLALMGFQHTRYYAETTLKRVCTPQCEAGLSSYEAAIRIACAGETWKGFNDKIMPLDLIATNIRYEYNSTCLMDSGRYCNVIAAQAAAAADPAHLDPVTGTPLEGTKAPPPCDLCFIKALRFQAESPFYDGQLLSSMYTSKTSSCKVTGMPLTTSTLPDTTTTPSPPTPQPTCSGKSYNIQSGDTCYSVSKSQQIGIGWLIIDNNLDADCADFPTTGTLCLVNTCKTVTVQENETCEAIATKNEVTVPQLKAWNLVINAGCNNMNRLNGSDICISAPGTPYKAPTGSTVLAPITPTTAAPKPTDAADGTNEKCGQYYHVETGDFCNLICLKFGISLDDFVYLNPVINSNCTNLFADEGYCVAPVGDLNTYSGRPGFTSAVVTAITGTQVYSTLPTATYKPIPFNNTRVLADGTRDDCVSYFDGSKFPSLESLNVTTYNSVCDFVAEMFLVTALDLQFWNPGLGDSSLPNCTFQPGVSYCARWSGNARPDAQIPIIELPIREQTIANCTKYTDVVAHDTCAMVLDENQLTIQQFFAYNPAVGADCANLWLGYRYCVRTPDYTPPATASTTIPSPTSTTPPHHPMLQLPRSREFRQITGDSCASLEDKYFITDAQFHSWNPAVSADCAENFWQGFYYCVGTSANTISRSTPSPPTATASAVPLPSPIQENSIISNCNSFAKTVDGEFCSLFAEHHNISTADLYDWNRVLGIDGVACDLQFWLGYYYCIGVGK